MNDAVFISDLHLHPDEPDILQRFKAWVDWAILNTQSVYILGDFFHAWAGDDTLNAWSRDIACELRRFKTQDITVYFIHGNRDFLLGHRFAEEAGIVLLTEPVCLTMNNTRVLLVHGDRYCTEDKAHQRFRHLTRNRLFVFLFLCLPKQWRINIVTRVRQHSQSHQPMNLAMMDVVVETLSAHAAKYKADVVVHGHTHRPKMIEHKDAKHAFKQIILSDWEEKPQILCYNLSKGFYFNLNAM